MKRMRLHMQESHHQDLETDGRWQYTDSWTVEKNNKILPSFSYLLTLVDPGDADVAPITVFASVV